MAGDIVTDFTQGQDRIGLGGFDGTLAFIEGEGFYGGAPAARAYWTGTTTRVQVDHDGDAAPDCEFDIVGYVELRASDFIL